VSSQTLVTTMYDPTPVPRVFARPEATGDNRGSVKNLVRGVLAHRARQAIRAVQFVPELVTACTHLLLPDARTLRYRPIHGVPRAPRTLLNVGITGRRAYAARTMSLSAVKQLARQTDSKINDVVLAICSGALRGYLGDRRALPGRSLTAMVPIASRATGDLASANHNSLMLCSLASDIADPYDRLRAIHRSCIEQKQNQELWKEFPVPEISFPGLGAIVRRFVARYGRSWFVGRPPVLGNLVISNVPGPPVPLYIAGARVESMYPCSIPFHGQAVNITVESYCDRLDFGVIACPEAVPDVAELADRLPAALAELQRAVAQTRSGDDRAASPARVPERPTSPARVPEPVPPATVTNGKHQPAVMSS
jgi:WS/DGAT/MGAT family acyltransferase